MNLRGEEKMGKEKKIIIPLSDCVPGMIIRQPIIDTDTGCIIVPKDQVLTPEILVKVKKFQKEEVWISVSSKRKVWCVSQEVMAKYMRYIDVLESVITSNELTIDVKIEEVQCLAKCIVEEFECNFDALACIHLVKNLNKSIYAHSINVALLSLLIGRWIGLNKDELQRLTMAGILHDIGTPNIHFTSEDSKEVLKVKNTLEYQRHPIYAYELLKQYKEMDKEILKAVLAHHERCDGSGYPLHLLEGQISKIAKILGIADEYDCMKKNKHIFSIVKSFKYDKIRQFDLSILLIFCNHIINYYIGANVVLSNGQIGEVVFIQPNCIYRPIIKVDESYIDLYENPTIEIVNVLE